MAIIMPYLIYTVLILASLFLQAEVFPYLQIFGAKPDLLLLIVAFSALKTDWRSGLIVGVMAGFWLDLLMGAFFGLNILMYGLLGLIIGFVRAKVDLSAYYMGYFVVLAASLLGGLLSLLLFDLVGGPVPTWQSIIGIIVPMTFYNLLLVAVTMPVTYFRRKYSGLKVARLDLMGGGIIFTRNNELVDSSTMEAVRADREMRARRKADRLRSKRHHAAERPAAKPRSQTRRKS